MVEVYKEAVFLIHFYEELDLPVDTVGLATQFPIQRSLQDLELLNFSLFQKNFQNFSCAQRFGPATSPGKVRQALNHQKQQEDHKEEKQHKQKKLENLQFFQRINEIP